MPVAPPAPRAAAGPLAVMLAAVMWGTTGTTQALSGYAGSPLGLGTARIAVAGLILLAVAAPGHGRTTLRALWRPGTRGVLLLGAAGIATYQVCFFLATATTGVAVGTLTAIGSAPVLAGALTAVLGARPTFAWLAATAVAVTGLGLLVAPTGGAQVRPLGVLAGLGAGGSYAVYTWCSRRLLDAGMPPLPLLAALFVGGAALLAPLATEEAVAWCTDPDGALSVAYLAVGATVLPYLIWIRGMASTTPAVATTLTLAEPLTATLLGVLVLDETLSPVATAGAVLVAAGLLLTVIAAVRRARAQRGAPPGGTGVRTEAGRVGRRPL